MPHLADLAGLLFDPVFFWSLPALDAAEFLLCCPCFLGVF